MSAYYVCLECETPCYVFEETEGELTEALCAMCGNSQPDQFLTEEEHDSVSSSSG